MKLLFILEILYLSIISYGQKSNYVQGNYFVNCEYKYEKIPGTDTCIYPKKPDKNDSLSLVAREAKFDSLIKARECFYRTHKIVDTIKCDSTEFYFPLSSYTDYNSDFFDTIRLFLYSVSMEKMNEPILYNKNIDYDYFRYIFFEDSTTYLYRFV